MEETILFGKLNSRKKHTKKLVIMETSSGARVLLYEKKVKRWEFVTDDVSKIICDDPRYIHFKRTHYIF